MEQARTNRPLPDVTVIDFGQIFQGPYASLLLAKAGARSPLIRPAMEPDMLPLTAAEQTRHI